MGRLHSRSWRTISSEHGRWRYLEAAQYNEPSSQQLNYWKGDYMSISRELQQVNWASVLDTATVEDSWLSIKTKVYALMDKYIPWKKVRVKKKKSKWMSSETRHQLKIRNQAWKKYEMYRRLEASGIIMPTRKFETR